MISLFSDTGARKDIQYNGLSLNVDESDEDQDYTLTDTVGTRTGLDYVSEMKPQEDGLEVYAPRKAARIITLKGWVAKPTYAELYDRMEEMAEALDPSNIAYQNSDPFLPLRFTTVTADTTNHANGVIDCCYFALPLAFPEPVMTDRQGIVARWECSFMLKDPRRYAYSATTQSGAGTITDLGGTRVFPTLTITMAGAGSATYAVRNGATVGVTTLTLDLSGLAAADEVVVDMATRTITVNDVTDMSLYVSGDYFPIEPGSNVITYTNTTNATSVLTYRTAYSL